MSQENICVLELMNDGVFTCRSYSRFANTMCNTINFMFKKIAEGKVKNWQKRLIRKLPSISQDLSFLIGSMFLIKIRLSAGINDNFKDVVIKKLCKALEHFCVFFGLIVKGTYDKEKVVMESRSYFSDLKKIMNRLIKSSKPENSLSTSLFIALLLPILQNLIILSSRSIRDSKSIYESLESLFHNEMVRTNNTLKSLRKVLILNHKYKEKISMKPDPLTSAPEIFKRDPQTKLRKRKCTLEIVYQYPLDFQKATFKIVSIGVATEKRNPEFGKGSIHEFIPGADEVYEKEDIYQVKEIWKKFQDEKVNVATKMVRKFLKAKMLIEALLECSKVLEKAKIFCACGKENPVRNNGKNFRVFKLDDLCSNEEEEETEGEEIDS